jgi:hypothetical protein
LTTNPDNHEDLDRLEDLYLRYYFSEKNKSFIQVGKFHLKTPLINLQDGRMRPNLQEGIWAEWNESKKIKVKGGWLWRTSPRSTIHWYDIGKSLVYPNGRAINGNKADYSQSTIAFDFGVDSFRLDLQDIRFEALTVSAIEFVLDF